MTAPVMEDDAMEEPAINDGAVIPTGFVAQRIERFSIGTRSSLPSARSASGASLPSRSASGTSLPSRSRPESAIATAPPPHHPMVVNVIVPPQPQPQPSVVVNNIVNVPPQPVVVNNIVGQRRGWHRTIITDNGFPYGWKMPATSEMHLAHGFAWPHSRHQDLFGLWVEVKTIFETTLGGNWQGETRSETSYSGHLADSRLKPTSLFSLGITLKAPVASTKTEAIKELRSHCWLKGVTKSMKNSPLLRDALTRVRSVLELHDETR